MSYIRPTQSVLGLCACVHVCVVGWRTRGQLLGLPTWPSLMFGACAMKAAGFLAPAAWQMGLDLCSN